MKLAWFGFLGLILYGIYLTNSRGTILGLLLMLTLFGWLKLNRTLVISLIGIMAPLAFAATRLSTINSSEASAAGRIDAWTEGFYMLSADPLFGVGHGMFTDHHFRVAHSSYVQTFAEIGLVGYFFWLGFLITSMLILYQFAFKFDISRFENIRYDQYIGLKNISITVMFSLLGFAGSALFITRSTQPLLYILCGMSAGIIFLIHKNFPQFEIMSFRKSTRPIMFVTVISIVFIYIIIRLFW